MQASARIWRHFDVWLLAVVSVLTIWGVALIQSAIGGNVNLAKLVPRQAIYAAIGLAVVMIVAAIDYRLWSALARPIYLVTIVLLGLIPAAGFVGFGAARWFNVGIAYVQPSEVAKVAMILVLADCFAKQQEAIGQFKTVLRSLLLVAVPALLIFSQPDLKTTLILGVIWFALAWLAGLRPRHLALILGVGLILPILAWPLLQPYQQARVIQFLFPDPEAQYGATYNVNQALIAIGSGGWFGQGYGSGTQAQLRFLKVRHTDFIFSVLSEEFGFLGAVVVLVLLAFVIFRCFRAARVARDTFGGLICYGVGVLLLMQVAFNVGMNLNLFPVSGLTLPFLSYGGSSLVASLLGIGLVESVVLRQKRIEF
ncbi:MAG: FtsW/RodA/SpoVE family cell cycle protein [Chloroflexota bacterium]